MSIIEEMQEFRQILCLCPCCGELVRVSDLTLQVKGVKKTWLDDFERLSDALDDKEAKFDEKKGKIREEANERGRKAADRIFNNAISPAFKALKLDPHDVKPILNPVDFVVFKGMWSKSEEVTDIIFLSKKSNAKPINFIRGQVDVAVKKKNYDWQVARIDEKGKIEFE